MIQTKAEARNRSKKAFGNDVIHEKTKYDIQRVEQKIAPYDPKNTSAILKLDFCIFAPINLWNYLLMIRRRTTTIMPRDGPLFADSIVYLSCHERSTVVL